MKVVSISDSHNKHNDLKLPDGDMLIHAGDISGRGYEFEIIDFLDWFNDQKQFTYRIFIAGNHDFYFQDNPVLAKEILSKYPDLIYLQDQEIIIENIKIYGSPVQPKFFNWAFNVERGADIKKYWDNIPNDTDILITHGPPKGHGDYTSYGNENVGCVDLMNRVNEIKPKYHIFGHIHEANGVTTNEHTIFINASVLNEKYEVVNQPKTFII